MPKPLKSKAILVVKFVDVRPGYVFQTSDGSRRFIVTVVRPPYVDVEATEPGDSGNVAARTITDLVFPSRAPGIAYNMNPATGGAGPGGIVGVIEQAARP